jgi:hypothetical protein
MLRMRSLLIVFTATIMLAGCASEIMKTYIGKTVADIIYDYGPPTMAFDVGGSRRAFIWTMSTGFILPGTSTTQGNITGIGNSAFYSATTTTMPAQAVNYQCSYTGFAEKIPGIPDGPAAWRLVEFRKPRLMCE